MKYREVFERFDIFDVLNDEERKMIGGVFVKRLYKAKDVIYDETDNGGALYLLIKGRVNICRRTKDSTMLPYATIGEGEIFGLVSFIDGAKHSATAIADDALVDVLIIQREDFEWLLLETPVLTAKVYKQLGMHLCRIARYLSSQYMDLSDICCQMTGAITQQVSDK
ncbi:Cyclic nucleotide-binding domain protein [Candidatus Magnetobacterium bavaricum]|uniref:Cyclic nucleotide-binding domain protein n=1 Tax=Candidatus Magnetobacterium bavaricum TaxID=29290 RepID=A0A0F3GSC4_9BACT|nr:Cyclic nucleotide-binding domain protein [Candidatus Magnetobacterium bavaricum]